MTTHFLRALVVTGGHRVAFDEFSAMFDVICAEWDWTWQHAVQPVAQRLLHPGNAGRWDVVVLHDIAGLQLARGTEPAVLGPDAATRAALTRLLAAGQGMVVTHHALASWPGWDGWAHAIGGRFLYAPGTLDGARWPSSGYCHLPQRAEVVAADHPICEGVDDFDLDDEPYLCPVFEDEVVPLLRRADVIDGSSFRSAHAEVVAGEHVDCGDHPPVAPLLGWVKAAGNSPLVYLQPGDGPSTFAHPSYRRLLANSMAWVASHDAHQWSRAHSSPIPD